MYCSYYQATVNVSTTWFVTGIFRADECVAFERTIEHSNNLLEFFVPGGYEEQFVFIMNALTEQGYVHAFNKLPNRFTTS